MKLVMTKGTGSLGIPIKLCAQENNNGTNLFPRGENEQDLSQLVNKYLPLKVERDGKFPILICPGCNIQLEATKQFLDLIIEGQNKLRDLFRSQQDTLRRQEKQRLQLESALKNVNPSSSVETYTIQSDESGEKFVIQIFSEGPLFPPEHEMSLKAEGLERPKRKRGRPPKPPPPVEGALVEEDDALKNDLDQDVEDDGDDLESRRKRKIKVPSRFQEAVQGKELDRIFKEEGVLGEDSFSEDENHLETENSNKGGDEVIGHLQSREGEDLGELVVVNRSTNKIRIKNKDDSDLVKRKKYECEICGREFLHHGRYEAHKTFHKNIKYQCCTNECGMEHENKAIIEKHQRETGHTGILFFECIHDYGSKVQIHLPQSADEEEENKPSDDNNEEVENDEQNLNHPVDIVENKFTCSICSKNFSCKQNFEVHQKAVHENHRPYQCDKCEKSFPYINSLKCHMLQHSEKNEKLYPCEVCNKVFNHPSSLVYHREAEHNNGRRFVCNKCNKSFKHKQLLQRHQLVHSNERPHTCKLCDASFKTRANLLNHMPIHTGEKKYYCTQCGQSFAHKTSLTLHMRWHSGQKPYECDVCMKTFSQKGNLAEHKRIHTGEKPFCCDHCGRKFTTSSQFKLHVKRHTGERPWRCEYCSKTFLHKDTWKCHTRRHRNERPYQCKQCFRGFTEQWALKKHERLHTGEKPYVCDICQKGFADCSNLTKHKKVHGNPKLKKTNVKPKNLKMISSDGVNQVVYLAYQESNSSDGVVQTLVHIMDPLEGSSNDETDALQENAYISPILPESLSHFQELIDEDGSAISLTTSDGQQVKVLATVEEGQQNLQCLMPNGTLVPINLTVQNGKPVVSTAPLQSDIKIPDSVINENQSTSGSGATNQLLENNIQFLNEDVPNKLDNSIQFLTEDGQNICFVTAYNIDEGINPHYLAMA
ncbi:hypothetical protein FQR65_LT01222 [Abscondita terminalis]|nr:hypothetical protein FQR65_LT01222 [Abscondita terminalis]